MLAQQKILFGLGMPALVGVAINVLFTLEVTQCDLACFVNGSFVSAWDVTVLQGKI